MIVNFVKINYLCVQDLWEFIEKMFKNLKQKFRQPYNIEKVFEVIFWITFVLSIIASIFDLSITYYSYIIYNDNFFLLEANKFFSWGIKNNLPIIINPSVLLQIIFLCIVLESYFYYKKKKNYISGHLFISLFICNIISSILHAVGGFSWLYVYNG